MSNVTAAPAQRRGPPPANVRHDIDPALVKAQVEKKIAEYEDSRKRRMADAQDACARYAEAVREGTVPGLFSRKPEGPEAIGKFYDDYIARERTYYAAVRVIERPVARNRFILVYGEADDATVSQGTGGFSTFEEAAAWYLNGGR